MRTVDVVTAPHRGALVMLQVDAARAAVLQDASREWVSWSVSARQLCDLELLSNGAFSPLTGFLTSRDYYSVCERMRLADNTLWPMPITLDVPATLARQLTPGSVLALRDPEGLLLAALHVEDVWERNPALEAATVFGTTSREHPGVLALERASPFLVGGRLEVVRLPVHDDCVAIRRTPTEVRADLAASGWPRVVAFQTGTFMHRAEQALTLRVAHDLDAGLLIQSTVGVEQHGSLAHLPRVRCCESLLASYSPTKATIVALPLATRFAGPREALWHAIIQKNYGCTHFMVGSDHASPANRPDAKPFYLPTAAQELVDDYSDELGIAAVRARTFVYLRQQNRYVPEHEASSTDDVCHLSAAELGQRLADGHDLPEWFTFPSVARELRRAHPPRTEQGFTVFFTGLSGSGKSTVAKRLYVRLMELGGRPVTLLDGDIVRKHLSSELGFSREHRDINITRIGFVASEITKNGGIALCAPIAPFDSVRKTVRQMVSAGGGFILVHIATPLEICERRDPKGLYAKARAGLLQQFTGVSDAYESPDDAEVVIDTTRSRPQQAVDAIIEHLRKQKYLPMPASATVTEENPKIEAPF